MVIGDPCQMGVTVFSCQWIKNRMLVCWRGGVGGERDPNILIPGSNLALTYVSIMQECQKKLMNYAALESLIILGKLF